MYRHIDSPVKTIEKFQNSLQYEAVLTCYFLRIWPSPLKVKFCEWDFSGLIEKPWFTPQGWSVPNQDGRRSCLSSQGHISKKIPPDIAETQYLGFTMMRPWESALRSLNPKYWVSGYQANRYGLEKMGMTGWQGPLNRTKKASHNAVMVHAHPRGCCRTALTSSFFEYRWRLVPSVVRLFVWSRQYSNATMPWDIAALVLLINSKKNAKWFLKKSWFYFKCLRRHRKKRRKNGKQNIHLIRNEMPFSWKSLHIRKGIFDGPKIQIRLNGPFDGLYIEPRQEGNWTQERGFGPAS